MKLKLRSFKSSEHIDKKGDGPYRGFGYLSLFSDPIDLATWSQKNYCNFATFNRAVVSKTSIIHKAKTIKCSLENESKP